MIDRDSEKVKTLKQVIEDQKFVIDTLKEAYDEKKNTIHINTEPSALSTEFWEQRGKEAAERINAKNEIKKLKHENQGLKIGRGGDSIIKDLYEGRIDNLRNNYLSVKAENKTLRKKARQILQSNRAKDRLIEHFRLDNEALRIASFEFGGDRK